MWIIVKDRVSWGRVELARRFRHEQYNLDLMRREVHFGLGVVFSPPPLLPTPLYLCLFFRIFSEGGGGKEKRRFSVEGDMYHSVNTCIHEIPIGGDTIFQGGPPQK